MLPLSIQLNKEQVVSWNRGSCQGQKIHLLWPCCILSQGWCTLATSSKQSLTADSCSCRTMHNAPTVHLTLFCVCACVLHCKSSSARVRIWVFFHFVVIVKVEFFRARECIRVLTKIERPTRVFGCVTVSPQGSHKCSPSGCCVYVFVSLHCSVSGCAQPSDVAQNQVPLFHRQLETQRNFVPYAPYGKEKYLPYSKCGQHIL